MTGLILDSKNMILPEDPAEPESLMPLEERAHGNGQPAGQVAAIAAWDGHAVRHYDAPISILPASREPHRGKIRPAIE